jgi:hypothetical protein
MSLTDDERKAIAHALTGSHGNGVYRNYHAAEKVSPLILGLVDKGFMERGRRYGSHGGVYYHVTQAGAEAVGLRLPDNEPRQSGVYLND